MAAKLKSFDDVVGHRNLIAMLKKMVQNDKVSDVIIFHGNPGIGKSSIAKILAVEVACRYKDADFKEKYIDAVIMNNQSTDSIKLFNMSEIQEKEEEIQKVKAEMNTAFSATGRKVLILDEAHNMSRKAQDAILTELEHLDKGIYVFICTTEINSLRSALKSRSKATFRLSDLSEVEARKVLNDVITERRLMFNIATPVVTSLIISWAECQPRQMLNLLENFEDGAMITTKELEVFMDMSTASSVIELLKYLYGSLTLGLEYLDSMKFDESFAKMLIEVTKVALGHTSTSMSSQDIRYIKDFMQDKDTRNILKFCAIVTGLGDLRRRKIVSAFIKSHVSYDEMMTPSMGQSIQSRGEDIKTLSDNVQDATVYTDGVGSIKVSSLDEMFAGADTVN